VQLVFYLIVKIKIQRSIILLLFLYECETWSLTFREVVENRLLRKIFGS